MSEFNSYDVAVVGYGPTGVTAANLLGAMGLRVLVVERDASLFDRARAIATDEEVVRIWQQLGLAERLKLDMLHDRPIDFVDERGRSFLSLAPRSRGNGHPTQLFIYQPALEQTLRDGVARYPNVELLLGHECLRLRQDDEGVELTLADLATDTVQRVRARYVIAADGGSSPIRAQLGVGFEGKTYEDRWVVIDTEVVQEWPTHDRLRFHCDPARPAVDCPTPLGHHRWEFPVLPGEDEAELVSDAAVWRLLGRQGITAEQVTIMRAVVYSHHVRFASRWRVGRVFLAGDAAHVMPPWIGQGMSAGVRDAANLCWKLAAVVHQALPEDVLDSYETERQPHVRKMTEKAVFFGRIITERRPLLAALRNPAFRLGMRLPLLGSYLRDGKWFPRAYYSKGFLATERASAVGHRPPQPFVLGGDGETVRLDDVLGSRWLVIRTAGAADQRAWADAGVDSIDIAAPDALSIGTLVDVDDVLTGWLRRHGADVIAIRPDGFVYAAAGSGSLLPPPPVGLKAVG